MQHVDHLRLRNSIQRGGAAEIGRAPGVKPDLDATAVVEGQGREEPGRVEPASGR